ncbi:DUF805 domain-containing protein [Marinibacterium profundimaris]|uniref:DUF805 domain-containing protein n=1 Tax=Marinibacterium profundimaris TaxID=1679460 RepID=A0A225NTL6_9RHOB|nr:DUF805 domain-containing protein [Marinibacterium profundimaris]OWU77660.1 hypothetical protein ATO3_03005 [Marinibacterium profundimaris]
MSFGQAIRLGYRRCVTFRGRASRPEFWYFVLFFVLGSAAAGQIDTALFGEYGAVPASTLFLFVGGFPLISAGWRRMHDTGRSGLFLFYPAIVLIGTTSFIGFLGGVMPTEPGVAFAQLREAIGAIGGLVAFGALIVLVISPLLVLWWLTRPSERGQNKWGWPPA